MYVPDVYLLQFNFVWRRRCVVDAHLPPTHISLKVLLRSLA